MVATAVKVALTGVEFAALGAAKVVREDVVRISCCVAIEAICVTGATPAFASVSRRWPWYKSQSTQSCMGPSRRHSSQQILRMRWRHLRSKVWLGDCKRNGSGLHA